MSNFFSWGFKAGQPAVIVASPEGYPLEYHPKWTLRHYIQGSGPSNAGWSSSDGRAIRGNPSGAYANISYGSAQFVNGTISGRITTITSDTTHYFLCLAGRMLDSSNMIGIRAVADKYLVVQRRNGNWKTLFDGGTATIEDIVEFVLNGNTWKIVVNGSEMANGTHNLPETPGYWGCSTHQVKTGDNVLVRDIEISDQSSTTVLDLDQDGKPDTSLAGSFESGFMVTEDEDSINVLVDGQVTVFPKP